MTDAKLWPDLLPSLGSWVGGVAPTELTVRNPRTGIGGTPEHGGEAPAEPTNEHGGGEN